jgi:hypothetical protein
MSVSAYLEIDLLTLQLYTTQKVFPHLRRESRKRESDRRWKSEEKKKSQSKRVQASKAKARVD